ncbi:uncharacterized protein LOC131177828 [Hevea brasiliensis]|uniref:uncharacterized protein LOC131177828 n=1 Tax=Hevea brasiliensis TaxID=3981 RepID=UPI0025D4A96C|nr:uncharacterized protein LOC131177828 [Hevea brasiliensis]
MAKDFIRGRPKPEIKQRPPSKSKLNKSQPGAVFPLQLTITSFLAFLWLLANSSNKALEESLSTGYFGCVLILGIQTVSLKFTNHTVGIQPTSPLSSSVSLLEMRRAHDCSSWGKRKRQEAENIKLIQNKQYGRADDEYDFEDGPCRKSRKKVATQQERCLFCFENPNQPKHLVVSIANFTYLMLPRWQPVVPGHCFILPMQHESATRSVDNYVWEEIRNFKKCLIMMFAKQGKDLVFLETVMGLAQQRRHCLIECIPLPQKIAKQAPLYFKKAIEEAEHEWSQHNAKKLIDTSLKGLRGSVPKDFPYFHVEFGLNSGFVHVMDDERQFKSTFGLDVIRGMLRLPEEEVYRRRRHESVDAKKQAVANFARDWEPFDWTKQLN